MRCFAEQHDARVADALDQTAERDRIDVVDALRALAHELRDRAVAGAVMLGPTLRADERHEAHGAERLFLELRLADARDPQELLRADVLADGDDEASANRELRAERSGHAGSSRGDGDRIIRRVLGPTERAVAAHHVDVVVAELREPLLRRLRELGHALHREHVLRDATEDRGRVSRSGSDLEHAITAAEAQSLHGERNDVRLRDRLTFADRKRRVVVCELGEILRDELFAWDAAKRVEDFRIADVSTAQVCFDHVFAF